MKKYKKKKNKLKAQRQEDDNTIGEEGRRKNFIRK